MKWSEFALGEITVTTGGSTPKRNQSEFWNGNIPWVTPTDLPMPGQGIAEVFETADYITESGLASCSTSLLPVGTVLFSSRATIGKLGIAQSPITTNQGFVNFIPKPCLYNRYLAFALQHYTPQITLLAGSTTFKEVSRGSIRKFKIPLPPLSEQHRIVEILDRADALRKKRAEADAKAERILPALFIKMFGDPSTNPMGWVRGKLGDVVIETQYGISTRANSNCEGVPILRMNNIDFLGRLDLSKLKYVLLEERELKKHLLKTGDILFNRTNSKELVGKTGMWKGKMEVVPASYLIRVRVDTQQVMPQYIWTYMNMQYMKQILFEKARRAIGMANINAEELRFLPVMIPDISLQKSFSEKIAFLDRLSEHCSKLEEKINYLFQILLQHAFSGALTAKWREAHMSEILAEMEQQAKIIGATAELHYEQLALIEAQRHLT